MIQICLVRQSRLKQIFWSVTSTFSSLARTTAASSKAKLSEACWWTRRGLCWTGRAGFSYQQSSPGEAWEAWETWVPQVVFLPPLERHLISLYPRSLPVEGEYTCLRSHHSPDPTAFNGSTASTWVTRKEGWGCYCDPDYPVQTLKVSWLRFSSNPSLPLTLWELFKKQVEKIGCFQVYLPLLHFLRSTISLLRVQSSEQSASLPEGNSPMSHQSGYPVCEQKRVDDYRS